MGGFDAIMQYRVRTFFMMVVWALPLLLNTGTTVWAENLIQRLCPQSAVEGVWRNTQDSLDPRDIYQLEIEAICNGTQTALKMRVETECGRTPCRWNWTPLVFDDSRHLALFETFSANRRVILKQRGLLLEGVFDIDFHAATRNDVQQSWLFTKIRP